MAGNVLPKDVDRMVGLNGFDMLFKTANQNIPCSVSAICPELLTLGILKIGAVYAISINKATEQKAHQQPNLLLGYSALVIFSRCGTHDPGNHCLHGFEHFRLAGELTS